MLPAKYRPLVVLLLVNVLAVTFASHFELFEALYKLSRTHEDWDLDEILVVFMLMSLSFPIFAFRRGKELRLRQDALIRAEAQAMFAATHDSLTSLGNRRRYLDTIAKMAQGEKAWSTLILFLIDLDRFKPVNDLRGHDVGDQVLIEVAKRLRQVTPPRAEILRLGGDEFAVLVDPTDLEIGPEDLADAIIGRMEEEMTIGNFTIMISCSIGIAAWAPGLTATCLINHADQALYAAKASGRADYRLYDEVLGHNAKEEAILQADLIEAVVADELYCVFQPYFDLQTNRLVGAEALARWKHPTLGHVPPDRFIPMADQLGLIDRLSDQILNRACAAAKTWPSDMVLSFNVSPSQFSDRSLSSRIIAAITRHGISGDRFEVEVTETALVSDTQRARHLMDELSEAGILIALDDFGTGTSSLSLLTQFPFRRLKIDRSFVANLHNDPVRSAITSCVASLAHSLDLALTAEGIEHPEEIGVLKDHLPMLGQGYLLGRPISGDDLRMLIKKRQASDLGLDLARPA